MPITDDDPSRPWDEVGVREVTEGVHRIPLPMPGDGLRAVNCYALTEHDGRLTLIDPGVHHEPAQRALADGLDALGATATDVREVLVTHYHYDHYAQAILLRRRHGTPVALGHDERTSLEALRRGEEHRLVKVALLRRFGAPDLAERAAADRVAPELSAILREGPDRWLHDDDELALDGTALRAVHTPGHTRGHVVFRDDTRGLLYAGDHVLSSITPSIGYEAVPASSPLGDYLASLHRVRTQDDLRLLPAHGHLRDSVHERIDELVGHHDRRLAASLEAVASGATSAAEVAACLPWTRRERRFADLDPFNRTLAVLETGFHLELLVARGVLAVIPEAGVQVYAAA